MEQPHVTYHTSHPHGGVQYRGGFTPPHSDEFRYIVPPADPPVEDNRSEEERRQRRAQASYLRQLRSVARRSQCKRVPRLRHTRQSAGAAIR